MNIIVIGDVMIDINYISEIKRNAPEADIPIYNISSLNHILGGASNVALNLKNLGTNVEIITVIGDDNYGNEIKNLFCSSQLQHKIFIDKEYLFNLEVIIETLNKAFGENIFKDSFEQIAENLKNSQDGILIKLNNKIYKIKRP